MKHVVEIAPIVKTVDVEAKPIDAFNVFTSRIGRWWPLATHTRARTSEGEVTDSIIIEPFACGRVFERLQDGRELDWGEVVAFEPGVRLLLTWRMGRPKSESTDVEVTFKPLAKGGCRVTLQHSGWERLDGGDVLRDRYNNGWVTVFEVGFGRATSEFIAPSTLGGVRHERTHDR